MTTAAPSTALATIQPAFTTLARRLIDPRLENDAPRYRTDVFRSFAELPITFSGIR